MWVDDSGTKEVAKIFSRLKKVYVCRVGGLDFDIPDRWVEIII